MFDSPDYPGPLLEATFDKWLEAGRESKIPFAYLLIIWDELDGQYLASYTENRSEIKNFARYGHSPEHRTLVAAYDLFSEGRIL
ncbi:hypothetical protein [Arthrospiribacter ruber]|uniref:Uncharacterized protein n=1 Tax=Arthrospiribacter ruber TaxID=2487934 RepID=A0A951J003_9BACT|nr:hypothetical protein [Arthrospiribacter ruber]MBW3469489.1 hypothetical protein [Arthrospiribacter ruber]